MRNFIYLIAIAICNLTIGCSGNSEPTLPAGNNPTNFTGSIPVGVSDWSSDGYPAGGFGVMGLYSLEIDVENTDASLIPLREAALTDFLEVVDITNFLTLSPCVDCTKIGAISRDTDGNLVLSIGIKHPFEVGDPLKPISGKNRGDLHVFNVEGIIASDATGIAFPGFNATKADFDLVNADGYSPYLDTSLDEIYPTDATIHPYILHFDDYSAGNFNAANPMGFESVTDPPPSGNLVMPMGCDYDYQDYVFNLESGPIQFIFAIGCTYAVSAETKNDRFTPEYRIPQHNKKAASEVRVNILSNDLAGGDALSSATLQVELLDINHGISVGAGLDEMLADSSVGSISVEVPEITVAPVVDSAPVSTGGDASDPANPLTFEISFNNDALGDEGTYNGLVKVNDNYLPGQNTSPLIMGMDGIKRVDPLDNPLTGLFSISEFATYASFAIDVSTGSQEPPVAIISSPCPGTELLIMSSLFFDGRLSTDDDPPLAGYAWDFDWDSDPVNFDIDSTSDHLNHVFDDAGIYTVGLRVEDSIGQFGYASILVNAYLEFSPPFWQMETRVAGWSGVEASERNHNPSHQIVMDCDNTAHMIFKFRSQGGPQSGLYYVNYTYPDMGIPEYIDGNTDGIYQPTLRSDYLGNLHLTYIDGDQIKYITRIGSTWSTPEVVVDANDLPGYDIQNPTMDINYLGDIMIVFNKYDSSNVSYNAYTINEGTGWSAVDNISECYLRIDSTTTLTPSEDVNADPEGRFHLFYVSWPNATAVNDYDLFHAIYENGSWSTPFKFNDDSDDNIALGGYASLDGDLFAVWQTGRPGDYNAMYQRYDGLSQTWGQSIRVSQNPLSGDSSFNPDITVTTEDDVMYVWEYFDGSYTHIYYKEFKEDDSASFILSRSEREFVTGAFNRSNPNLFWEPNGRVHCIYEDDRNNPGDYWSRDMYYLVWK